MQMFGELNDEAWRLVCTDLHLCSVIFGGPPWDPHFHPRIVEDYFAEAVALKERSMRDGKYADASAPCELSTSSTVRS